MDAPPSLETVLQALRALYHGDDAGGKERASLWLGELQKSVYAWQVSDQLLQLNHDIESCYFAAQTMRTKIQYSFEELPQTSHQSLRDSLIGHCTKVNFESPQIIVTQLCLALSDLVLQMSSWKNATQDLIQQFAGNVQYWTFLVELLSVLPEEIGSRPLRLGSNRRREIVEELEQASPLLMQLLSAVNEAAAGNSRVQAQVVHCLGSWLSVQAVPPDLVVSSGLLRLPFAALTNKDCPTHFHHAATECVCSTLIAIDDVEKHAVLARTMFDGVMTLLDAYHMSVALDDLDKSLNYSRIFTDLAETFVPQMISTPNQGFGDFRSLDLLLTCIGHHHYEVADITFTFWNHLSEILYSEGQREVLPLFSPYLQRLIIALARHCQFDAAMESFPEEDSDFDDFRKRAADIVYDFVFVVDANDVFCQMFETLKGVDGKGAPWHVCEAALFIMCAVAKRLSAESAIVAQVLMALLGQAGAGHLAVRHTSMMLIGELRDWISFHPEVLDSVLQFLLAGLQEPKLAAVASDSLQSICGRCSEQMNTHFAGLIEIVKAVDTFNICDEATMGLLKGSSHILSTMSAEQISGGMQQLCSMQAAPLSKMLEAQTPTKIVVGNKEEDPVIWLDRLAIIFRSTTPKISNGQIHPCQDVIVQLWPLLSKTFEKYSADGRVIERCCRCVRFAVRCLGSSSTVLLNPLVCQLVALYEAYPHSCCLYLGSILVDEYGGQADSVPMLLDMLQAFCTRAFKILDEPKGLRNHPDTVDDLFRLCYRLMQRSPVAFLQSPAMTSIVVCATACCCLDHKEANNSVTTFVAEFVRSARNKEDAPDASARHALAQALLASHGQALVSGVLKAVLFCLPSYMQADLVEIVYELMRVDRPAVCRWLEAELKSLPTQSAGGAVTATPQQLADFHKAVTSADELKMVARAFREFSRFFR